MILFFLFNLVQNLKCKYVIGGLPKLLNVQNYKLRFSLKTNMYTLNIKQNNNIKRKKMKEIFNIFLKNKGCVHVFIREMFLT